MLITITKADLSEAEALSALAIRTYMEAFGHSFLPEDLAAQLEHNSPERFRDMLRDDVFLLASKGVRLIGFAQFGDACKEGVAALPGAQPGDREIHRLYVAAEAQNLGVGTRLMNAALGHPWLVAASRVYLDVWEDNHGARRFYERFGFKRVGERAFFVASGAATGLDLVLARVSSTMHEK